MLCCLECILVDRITIKLLFPNVFGNLVFSNHHEHEALPTLEGPSVLTKLRQVV